MRSTFTEPIEYLCESVGVMSVWTLCICMACDNSKDIVRVVHNRNVLVIICICKRQHNNESFEFTHKLLLSHHWIKDEPSTQMDAKEIWIYRQQLQNSGRRRAEKTRRKIDDKIVVESFCCWGCCFLCSFSCAFILSLLNSIGQNCWRNWNMRRMSSQNCETTTFFVPLIFS